jgi:hypothetical protein
MVIIIIRSKMAISIHNQVSKKYIYYSTNINENYYSSLKILRGICEQEDSGNNEK